MSLRNSFKFGHMTNGEDEASKLSEQFQFGIQRLGDRIEEIKMIPEPERTIEANNLIRLINNFASQGIEMMDGEQTATKETEEVLHSFIQLIWDFYTWASDLSLTSDDRESLHRIYSDLTDRLTIFLSRELR